jgi:ketosteroid isomerase-like protein
MRRWLVALCSIAALAPGAVRADSAADRARIVALEHHWLDAIGSHDQRALEAILADGFIDINPSGRVRSRDEAIAHASAPAHTTQAITQLNVRVYGDTAVATGINTVHSRTQGWTVEIAFTDVFVRGTHGWQAVSAQETLRKPAG